jgi:hypothetical protein
MLPRRSPSLRQRRQRKFRREHGAEIEQRLEWLRRIWDGGQPGIRTKHDPSVAEAAMWFCNEIGWPEPPWLQQLAAKLPNEPVTLVEGRDFFIVPPNRTRHGPLMKWGKRQFVRGAIIAIGIPAPENMTYATVSKLWQKVKKLLRENPDFKAAELGPVSRRTVANELKKLQRTS